MNLSIVKNSLRRRADKKRAEILQGFFKTAPGEYAEGDIFLGLTAPVMRDLSKKFQGLAQDEVIKLLKSPIHKERMLALFLMTKTGRLFIN